MINLADITDLASRHVPGTATLSPESVAVLLSILGEAHDRGMWRNGNEPLTDGEWDAVDAMISLAEGEVGTAWL